MYLLMFGLGLTLGVAFCSLEGKAQSPFLDFGAAKQEDRPEIQQWYLEKEVRAGRNPYTDNPCQ